MDEQNIIQVEKSIKKLAVELCNLAFILEDIRKGVQEQNTSEKGA